MLYKERKERGPIDWDDWSDRWLIPFAIICTILAVIFFLAGIWFDSAKAGGSGGIFAGLAFIIAFINAVRGW